MNRSKKSSGNFAVWTIFSLAAVLVVLGQPSWCEGKDIKTPVSDQASEQGQDRTLSPYFFIQSDDPDVDQMPLKATQVEVNIAGVIADVKVIQLYKNEAKRPIEAIYVFPASTRAAVYGMKMTIGERTIVAEIHKREEARQIYEQAKNDGRSSSLLEQQRPNVFQMNVANILPGDEIKTELHYTELLTPTDRVYEFVYPTVVGPRYSNQSSRSAEDAQRWIENPYLQQGQSPSNKLAISVRLDGGLPIHELTCSSHQIDSKFLSRSAASVTLAEAEAFAGNRDFILKYRLAGEQIESGLLLHRGADENFFLLMMQPPERVSERSIVPREYIFIVDVSGSMHGFPLDLSKRLWANLIGELRPSDLFNVVLFAGGSQVFSPQSVPANEKNSRRAIDLIDRERGGGGTELLPALKKAFALPRSEGYSRTLIIATDGYVAVEKEAFEFIRSHLADCNFFTFGIGSSVNRYLIEGMARAGMGEPFVVSRPDDAVATAERFRTYIRAPILSKVKIDFGHFDVFDVEPLSVPDVFAERPVVVCGKWRGEAKGKISLHGVSGNGREYRQQINVQEKDRSTDHSALKYLWARSRVTQLDDDNRLSSSKELISELTALGLKYHLLTAYTSFVAIDEQVRLKDGRPVTVKQPLPLPEGVSNYAVGAMAPSPAASLSLHRAAAGEFLGGDSAQAPLEYKSEGNSGKQDKDQEMASGQVKTDQYRVELEQLETTGGLSREAVEKVVTANLAKIETCLGEVGQNINGLKIIVRWRVTTKGQVERVAIEMQSGIAKALQTCIDNALKQIKFGATEAETEVKATFALIG